MLTDIKRGSETHWLEMPLTGCTEAAGDAAAPYTCPRGAATPNPGYLSSVNTTAWTTREQVNGERMLGARGVHDRFQERRWVW